MGTLDKNGDGQFTFDEFRQFVVDVANGPPDAINEIIGRFSVALNGGGNSSAASAWKAQIVTVVLSCVLHVMV